MAGNTAELKLKADSSGIRKGTKDLDALARQSGKSEKATKRLSSSFAKMGKAAGIAGAAVGAMLARSVIRNTIEQQKAVAQLNAALKSTGKYTAEYSKELQNQAAALQKVSTYGDEAIIKGQNILLTFRNIGAETFPRATQAMLDTATAMGTDLKSAAIQLGKALNDPKTQLTALSRSGITFSESQKEVIYGMVEMNDLAGAQALILKELEVQFGGSAKAAKQTFGGAIDGVKNAFGDLLEVSGDDSSGVIGSLNDLEKTLSDPDIKEGFQTLATGVLGFIEHMARAPAVIGFVKDELYALFGIIKEGDLVRLDEQIAAAREELATATEGGLFGVSWDERVAGAKKDLDALIEKRERWVALAEAPILFPEITPGASKKIYTPGEEKDSSEEDAKAATDRAKAAQQATEELRQSIRDLAVEFGGPAVEAQQKYEDALAKVAEQEAALKATGDLSIEQQHQIQEVREGLLVQRNQELAAIQESIDLKQKEAEAEAALLTPGEQLIEQLKFEIELQGKSNEERRIAIALRQAEIAEGSPEAARVRELYDTLEGNQDAIDAMDAFRSSASDAFVDILDGSKSAKDAFEDFMDSMRTRILRMIAEKLMDKLFGAMGSTDTGSAGGGIANFFSSLFGSGRAIGGPAYPGTLHPVNERGPELYTEGNKQYLLPGPQGGQVTPTKPQQQSVQNITVNLPPTMQRRSAAQTAQEVARIQKRAASRNS